MKPESKNKPSQSLYSSRNSYYNCTYRCMVLVQGLFKVYYY